MIDGPTPLHAVGAPGGGAGTGKGKLVASVLAPSLGSIGEGLGAPPATSEEMQKLITSYLIEARDLIMFDNVDREVKYAPLQAALTTTRWTGRVLGESRSGSLEKRATWVLTGNALRFVYDLARRVLPINLDARTERPMDRTDFCHVLPTWAQGDGRSDLLWALCVLVRNWIVAGQPPPPPTVRAFGSFEHYRGVIGGILDVAGIEGFLGNIDQHAKGDRESDKREILFGGISEKCGTSWFKTSDVVAMVERSEEAISLFDDDGRPGNSINTKVGNFLTSQVGAYAAGFRLARSEKKYQHAWRYRLEAVPS